jgi:NADH:ubiquinone oxidoreductase subunit 6 (subunit J)
MNDWIYVLAFYAVSAVAALGALGVLFLRNLFHAGLSLILSLAAVAALFVLLGAEFLAGVQVLIYVGAVAVLILFAVMLTQRISGRRVPRYTRAVVPAALVASGLAVVTALVIWKVELPPMAPVPAASALDEFADLLLSRYLLPFEVISLLLLGALVGAIVLARKEERR